MYSSYTNLKAGMQLLVPTMVSTYNKSEKMLFNTHSTNHPIRQLSFLLQFSIFIYLGCTCICIEYVIQIHHIATTSVLVECFFRIQKYLDKCVGKVCSPDQDYFHSLDNYVSTWQSVFFIPSITLINVSVECVFKLKVYLVVVFQQSLCFPD